MRRVLGKGRRVHGDGGNIGGILRPAEEGLGGLDGLPGRLLAVHLFGDLIGQNLLGLVGLGVAQGAQAAHLVHGQEGEQAEAALHIRVGDVAPVLVEFIGAGLLGVQPEGALTVLPILTPSLVVKREKVMAKAGWLSLRRMRSAPARMLLHWSSPPISTRQP